jgi:invasion protein IalB
MGFARGLLTGGGAIPAIAALALALGTPAAAQDAPAEQAQSPWVKMCNTDPESNQQFCMTTQELRAENGLFIASVQIRTLGDKISLITAVPVGMLIEPGIRIQVDDGAQREVKYDVCFPTGCYAQLDVNNEFIGSLKRGNQLTVSVLNAESKPLAFPMTLIGFTAAYDGEGIDAAAAQQRQQELNDALQRRAEEARQRLIEEQRQEGEPPAGN